MCLKEQRHIRIGDREYDVDECLADYILALNAAGIQTCMSCCGHGEHEGFIHVLHNGEYRLLVFYEPGAKSLEAFDKIYAPMATRYELRRSREGKVQGRTVSSKA